MATAAIITQRPRPSKLDVSRRYALAGVRDLYGTGLLRVSYYDDAMRRYGPDVYERMMRDPVISAAVERLVVSVCGEPVISQPRIPETERRGRLALEIRDGFQRAWDRLPSEAALSTIVREGIKYGDQPGEVTLERGTGKDARRWIFESWVPVPRDAIGYAVDPFGRCLGLVAAQISGDPKDLVISGRSFGGARIVPARKFSFLTLRGDGNSPLGHSLLDPLVSPWNQKQIGQPERIQYLKKRIAPNVVVKVPRDAPTEYPLGPDGLPDETAEPIPATEAIAEKAANLANYGVLAVDESGDAKALDLRGNGEFIERFVEWCDQQALIGLLLSFLGQLGAKFGSRSQSDTHDMQPDLVAAWIRRHCERMIERGPARLYTTVNWPGVEDLVPIVSLGDTERKDWERVATAATQFITVLLENGYLEAAEQLIVSMGLSAARLPGYGRTAGEMLDDAKRGGKPKKADEEESDE